MDALVEGWQKEPLKWHFTDSIYILKNGEHPIVSVFIENKRWSGYFVWKHARYRIRTGGMWPSKQEILDRGDRTALSLVTHVLDKKSDIVLRSGNLYSCSYYRSLNKCILFKKAEENGLFTYRFTSNEAEPEIELYVYDHAVPEDDFLFLLVIGAFAMRGLIKDKPATEEPSYVLQRVSER